MEAAAGHTPGALDGPTLNSLTAEVDRLTAINAAMLAALEAAVSDFDNWGEVWQSEGGPDGEDVFTVLEACRAALALARGEVVRP